jgi:hypothetical protein
MVLFELEMQLAELESEIPFKFVHAESGTEKRSKEANYL